MAALELCKVLLGEALVQNNAHGQQFCSQGLGHMPHIQTGSKVRM